MAQVTHNSNRSSNAGLLQPDPSRPTPCLLTEFSEKISEIFWTAVDYLQATVPFWTWKHNSEKNHQIETKTALFIPKKIGNFILLQNQ